MGSLFFLGNVVKAKGKESGRVCVTVDRFKTSIMKGPRESLYSYIVHTNFQDKWMFT